MSIENFELTEFEERLFIHEECMDTNLWRVHRNKTTLHNIQHKQMTIQTCLNDNAKMIGYVAPTREPKVTKYYRETWKKIERDFKRSPSKAVSKLPERNIVHK